MCVLSQIMGWSDEGILDMQGCDDPDLSSGQVLSPFPMLSFFAANCAAYRMDVSPPRGLLGHSSL